MSRWLNRRSQEDTAAGQKSDRSDVGVAQGNGSPGFRETRSLRTLHSSLMSSSHPNFVGTNTEDSEGGRAYAEGWNSPPSITPSTYTDSSPESGVDGTTTEGLTDWVQVGAELERQVPDTRDESVSPGVDSCVEQRPDDAADEEREAGVSRAEERWLDARTNHGFLVRGRDYFRDKIKQPAGTGKCRLLGFDCFTETSSRTKRVDHIASRGRCREKVQRFTAGVEAPFLFIINIQVRGNPPISMVAYWAIDKEFVVAPERLRDPEDRKFGRILSSFADIPVSTFGGDTRGAPLVDDAPGWEESDERNRRFKLIPRAVEGPWIMRKAIGSTPVMLGTKIDHRYYRGENYIETDMDTGSSSAAAALCSRCRGFSRSLHVDIGIVLQSNTTEELPEALLGVVRLNGFGVEDPELQTELFA